MDFLQNINIAEANPTLFRNVVGQTSSQAPDASHTKYSCCIDLWWWAQGEVGSENIFISYECVHVCWSNIKIIFQPLSTGYQRVSVCLWIFKVINFLIHCLDMITDQYDPRASKLFAPDCDQWLEWAAPVVTWDQWKYPGQWAAPSSPQPPSSCSVSSLALSSFINKFRAQK